MFLICLLSKSVCILLSALQLSGQFSQRLFRKLPPRVCVPLKNIVSEEFLRAGSVSAFLFRVSVVFKHFVVFHSLCRHTRAGKWHYLRWSTKALISKVYIISRLRIYLVYHGWSACICVTGASFFGCRHIFLGFTKCGRYVLSYTSDCGEDDDFSFYTYHLYWWEFNLHSRLKQVKQNEFIYRRSGEIDTSCINLKSRFPFL